MLKLIYILLVTLPIGVSLAQTFVPPAENSPELTANGLEYQIQKKLQQLGLDPGPLDGRIGSKSHRAIDTFLSFHPEASDLRNNYSQLNEKLQKTLDDRNRIDQTTALQNTLKDLADKEMATPQPKSKPLTEEPVIQALQKDISSLKSSINQKNLDMMRDDIQSNKSSLNDIKNKQLPNLDKELNDITKDNGNIGLTILAGVLSGLVTLIGSAIAYYKYIKQETQEKIDGEINKFLSNNDNIENRMSERINDKIELAKTKLHSQISEMGVKIEQNMERIENLKSAEKSSQNAIKKIDSLRMDLKNL